jgi:hypothetical protein
MASVRLRLQFAIALVLLDGAAGPDRKKLLSPKITRSNKKKPFSMTLRFSGGAQRRPLQPVVRLLDFR